MRLVHLSDWNIVLVFRVFEAEVKLLGHVGYEHTQLGLCESSAETGASTAVEGNPAVGVALLAVRRQ